MVADGSAAECAERDRVAEAGDDDVRPTLRMDAERWWPVLVDVAVVVWVALFAVDVAAGQGVVDLAPTTQSSVRIALTALLVAFLLDGMLLYRWSEQSSVPFVRTNWIWIVTVAPWFRPFRLLGVGRAVRGVRTLRCLARSRRAGSLVITLRRMARRAWRRLRG